MIATGGNLTSSPQRPKLNRRRAPRGRRLQHSACSAAHWGNLKILSAEPAYSLGPPALPECDVRRL